MTFYRMHPEVAGGIGERTELDRSVHPPVVHRLHYEFDGWLGDELLESFPSFIISEHLGQQLADEAMTGFTLEPVEVTLSEQFIDVPAPASRPSEMPPWKWLRVHGVPGQDDLALTRMAELVVSGRACLILAKRNPSAHFSAIEK